MKLNVLERLQLLQILPKEGNFVTLKIVKTLLNNISIGEKEFKEFDIKQTGEQLTWNAKGNEDRELEIGEKATDIIIEVLKKVDKEGKLNNQMLSLYEKFIKEE